MAVTPGLVRAPTLRPLVPRVTSAVGLLYLNYVLLKLDLCVIYITSLCKIVHLIILFQRKLLGTICSIFYAWQILTELYQDRQALTIIKIVQKIKQFSERLFTVK